MGRRHGAAAATIFACTLVVAGCVQAGAGQPSGNDHAGPGAAAVAAAPATASDPDPAWILELAPDGNVARYRVREQLVGFDLPNDAVGVTRRISGRIALDADGGFVPGASAITVEIGDLESDQSRRDNFVRTRTLEADRFPAVTLRSTAARGLPAPLPSAGAHDFDLIGDLTIKDVTRPTTWRVRARFDGRQVSGTAATAFTFDDFGLTQPRVRVVLSVADTIRLEYDFRMLVNATAVSTSAAADDR